MVIFFRNLKIQYLFLLLCLFWCTFVLIVGYMGIKDLGEIASNPTNYDFSSLERQLLIVTLTTVIIGSAMSFLSYFHIRSSTGRVLERLNDLATGETDLTKRIETSGKGELDQIASLINTFIERVQTIFKEIRQQGELVTDYSQDVSELAGSLSSTAVEGQAQSEQVAEAAQSTGDQMNNIAAAMEEMTATVSEIAQHTATTSEKAREAFSEVSQAKEKVKMLGEASSKISEMSSLIGVIAEQTNLLALNATIEAARAGEAGKGFAVVANEVKDLAKQTGEAVQKIEDNVSELQSFVDSVIEVTDSIERAVGEVSDLANNVAAAVEEQTATVNEISMNAQAVTQNVGDLVQMGEGIKEAATQTAAGSEQAKSSAIELKDVSNSLRETLLAFTV